LFLIALYTSAQAGIADTIHTVTQVRIILPENTDGWEYYFQVEGVGRPAMKLVGRENSLTVDHGKKTFQKGYIYAVNKAKNRQTNNLTFKLTSKPVYLNVKGSNGVIVNAKRLRPSKYLLLRQQLPERVRMPW
jgi:hypothetical protein